MFLRTRIENALKLAFKMPNTMMLPFGLCGCQEQNTPGREFGDIEDDGRSGTHNSSPKDVQQMPLHSSSFIVSVDEWQTVQSGEDEIEKWLLSSDMLEFTEQIGLYTFKGIYKGGKRRD
ncbi:unnamed protein product [Cuscuta epithymum]|uniref:Uncharacterized protein n=1 Tax=Cuscuta epithymum TaxID=186058 RepID=A0AAV0DDU8_9ASTE|nr:unnamed protein product [Cuscuta epithymum]